MNAPKFVSWLSESSENLLESRLAAWAYLSLRAEAKVHIGLPVLQQRIDLLKQVLVAAT